MRPVRISAAAFAPVYSRVLEISIFHFRVARYSRWTGTTTERVGICNTRFRMRRVLHGFRFPPSLILFWFILVSNVTIIDLFPQSYWALQCLPIAEATLLETWAVTKDIASSNYASIHIINSKHVRLVPKFYRSTETKINFYEYLFD